MNLKLHTGTLAAVLFALTISKPGSTETLFLLVAAWWLAASFLQNLNVHFFKILNSSRADLPAFAACVGAGFTTLTVATLCLSDSASPAGRNLTIAATVVVFFFGALIIADFVHYVLLQLHFYPSKK